MRKNAKKYNLKKIQIINKIFKQKSNEYTFNRRVIIKNNMKRYKNLYIKIIYLYNKIKNKLN